jgi:hypothetical protein
MDPRIEKLKEVLEGPFPTQRLFGTVVYDTEGRRNAFIDPTPVDEEALANLLEAFRGHKRTVASVMFPNKAKGRVRAAQWWVNYGWNLITAIHLKQKPSEISGDTPNKYLRIALKVRLEQLSSWSLPYDNLLAENDLCQKRLVAWLKAEEQFGIQQPDHGLVRICSSCNQLCKEAWRNIIGSPEAKENPIIGMGCPVLWLFSPANHLRRNPKEKPLEAADYLYKVLLSGDSSIFPKIDAELKKIGVPGDFKETRAGGRIYRIPKAHLSKLPVGEGDGTNAPEPYLPVGPEEGYGIHEMPDIEDFEIEICTWDAPWQRV